MYSLFTFLQVVSNQWRGDHWGMHPSMGGGYGISWFWPIITMAFWIALIAGIVFLIRWLILSARAGSHGIPPGDSALEILKKRYARGEINKDEFEEKKRDLA